MDALHLPQRPLAPDEDVDRFNPQEFNLAHPKRTTSCDETPPSSRMLHPWNTSRAMSAASFKTRMCLHFPSGLCTHGNNCTFAHSPEELLRPVPLNREEEEKEIIKRNICRLFYYRKSCTYGDSCRFKHVEPGAFLESEQRRPPESSVTSVKTLPKGDASGSRQSEAVEVVCSDRNCDSSRLKNVYRKTRLCYKWEAMGRCPYGAKCCYAHGRAELRKPGSLDSDCMNDGPSASSDSLPINSGSNCNTLEQQKKRNLLLEGLKKLNGIYADWIDEIPQLGPDSPS